MLARMIRAWLIATVLIAALVGCQHSREARADVEFHLDDTFALAGGQDAVIAGEGLRIHFDEVLEDSRCPARVQCVWSGQARIAFVAQAAGGTPKTVAFSTNPAPDQNVQTAEVGQYVVKLLSLEPYPQTPEDTIPLDQYRATLEVSKTGP